MIKWKIYFIQAESSEQCSFTHTAFNHAIWKEDKWGNDERESEYV